MSSKRHKPRSGSLAYKPMKRAIKETPVVNYWPQIPDAKPLGFAGYKAGMTHATVKDNSKKSGTAGLEIFSAVTVIEVPPILVAGIRAYQNGYQGKDTLTDVFVLDKANKKLDEKDTKASEKLKKIEDNLKNIIDILLIVHTQPKLAGFPKKKPDIMEIGLGGKTIEEKLAYAKEKLGKEITIGDVFSDKSFIDVHSVTKGKGYQGVVKRHGTMIQPRKFGKGRRHIGSGGAWRPARKMWKEPLPGRMGYHTRTEYNKILFKIGSNVDEINPKGGFLKYGLIKNEYVILKGSVPGPIKRLIRFTVPQRQKMKADADHLDFLEASTESKQKA